ncbi:haloacid dehalogenase-like hydrolase [Nocardia sp. NPDC019395]|uniref:HAD family hydrolase n=1 Tax=Nocardia sp. NPDC019395 TaxID=3154686 RepID=UPI0033F7ED86
MGLTKPTDVLVLWDIDHTLIETRGVGRAAFAAAFEQVTGVALRGMPTVTGRTEPDIYRAASALHGLSNPPPFETFASALTTAYAVRRHDLERTGRRLPGAADALAHLASNSRLYQSVLTGNPRDVAKIKLETFGLEEYLDLSVGAYGDDDSHRPTLVSIARSRASRQYATSFDDTNTVLIGDSPGDISTAAEGGAHIVAVAAGGTPPNELTGADFILPALTDHELLERAVLSLVGP